MVFPFTLKGFPHKSSVLYSSFMYLFSRIGTIHVYGYYSYIQYYSRKWVLFIRRQQTLLESSVGAIEVDHSGTQQVVSELSSLSLSMLYGCGC